MKLGGGGLVGTWSWMSVLVSGISGSGLGDSTGHLEDMAFCARRHGRTSSQNFTKVPWLGAP